MAAAPARPPPAAHGAHIAAGEELAGSCTRSIDRRSRSSFKSANHDARCCPVDATSVRSRQLARAGQQWRQAEQAADSCGPVPGRPVADLRLSCEPILATLQARGRACGWQSQPVTDSQAGCHTLLRERGDLEEERKRV